MITSTHNPKIQWVRALQSRSSERHASKTFVVEGVRLAEEALAAGWEAQLVLYTPDLGERGLAVVQGFATCGAPVEQVTEPVLHSTSDTQTPQGILVALEMRLLPLPTPLDFAFIPDGVRDPGNLGTMLRTAAAAGVNAVFLPPGLVDPFSPKVVRSAMGAHFRLPIHPLTWDEIRTLVRETSLRVYLAAAREGIAFTAADFRSPLALLIGGEAEGASPEGQNLADVQVHIPMPGDVESLNAAIAAGILLFEVIRQRRNRS